MESRHLSLLGLLAASLCSASVRAATAVPVFPSDGVAVAGSADTFDPLREHLKTFKSAVDAKYHVCVVSLSDPENRAGREYHGSTVAYVDQVFEAWRAKLDPAASVVIALAIENRGIAIHPGSRWTRLGFEQDEVTRLIDGSQFGDHARAGDYGGALVALVEAVDAELGRRVAEEQQLVEELTAGMPAVLARVEALRKSAQELPNIAAAAYRAAVEAGEEHRAAEAALRAGDPRKAAALLDRARTLATQGEAALADAVARDRTAREAFAADAAELKKGLSRVRELSSRSATPLESGLEQIEREAAEAQEVFGEGDVARASALLAEARMHAAEAERALERRERDRRLWRVEVPVGAAGLGVFLMLVALGTHWRRRRFLYRLADVAVKEWERKLSLAADRLLQLENAHPFLFGQKQLVEKLEGATRTEYRAVGELVDDLFLKYARARELLAEAQAAMGSGGFFGLEGLKKAARLLDDWEVEVGTEKVKEHRLFLPEQRVLRLPAHRLLSDMDAGYGETRERLARLELAFVQGAERLHAVQRHIGACEQTLVPLAEQDLELSAWCEAIRSLVELRGTLASAAERDPVGQGEAITKLLAEAEALEGRLGTVRRAVREVAEQGMPEAERAMASVEQWRAQGLRMLEPVFSPEGVASGVKAAAVGVGAAVERGDADDATTQAHRCVAEAKRLARLVEETIASREQTPERIKLFRQRVKNLHARLPERTERIRLLRELYPDHALQPALDNVEEALAALKQAALELERAEKASADTAQRYLEAAEQVSGAGQILDGVDDLYQEIARKADELATARREAERALASAGGELERVCALLGEGQPPWASPAELSAMNELRERQREASGVTERPKPDWPELRKGWTALADEVVRLHQGLAAERAAWEEAMRLQQEVRGRSERVKALLEGSQEDRQAANDSYAEAQRSVAEFERVAQQGAGHWAESLPPLKTALVWLEESEKLASADFRAAEAAREAIATAHHALRSADRSYGHGVAAHLSEAQSALGRARARLQQRDYEGALSEARQAHRAARDAEREALDAVRRAKEAEERAARERREREERERRRREEARRSSGSTFRSGGGSSSSSGGGWRSSSGGSGFKSSSGGSTW